MYNAGVSFFFTDLSSILFKEISNVVHRLDVIEKKMDKLLVLNCPQLELNAAVSNNLSLPGLPVKNDDELTKWHRFLDSSINAASAVSFCYNLSPNLVCSCSPCIAVGQILINIELIFQVSLLSDYCTNDLKDSVYNILRKMLCNEVASTFNFKGVNKKNLNVKKSKFKDTCLWS